MIRIHGISDPARAPHSAHPGKGSRFVARFHGWLLAAAVLLAAAPVSPGAASPTSASPPLPEEQRLLEEMRRQGTNVARLFQLGDLCHDAGAEGDKKAVERAEGYLRRLLALQTNHVPGLALLGSVYTMKGRDAFWPNVQLRLVHEGNRTMDQAVGLDPENVEARLIRVFNNAHMPDFLGRSGTVQADLAWLGPRVDKNPNLISLNQRQTLALHQGRLLKKQHRTAEALKVWETAQALQPQSKVASELAAEIERTR